MKLFSFSFCTDYVGFWKNSKLGQSWDSSSFDEHIVPKLHILILFVIITRTRIGIGIIILRCIRPKALVNQRRSSRVVRRVAVVLIFSHGCICGDWGTDLRGWRLLWRGHWWRTNGQMGLICDSHWWRIIWRTFWFCLLFCFVFGFGRCCFDGFLQPFLQVGMPNVLYFIVCSTRQLGCYSRPSIVTKKK